METMQELNSQDVAQVSKAKHAGGRPRGSVSKDFWYKARGINPLVASEILQRVNEGQQWVRIFNSADDNVVLRAMMFLVQMRDGKPSQQINVTGAVLHVDANTIAAARAVARELITANPNLGLSPTLSDSHDVVALVDEQPTMATASPASASDSQSIIQSSNDATVR